ncbi:hypothetical protein VNO78_27090 [Psophocarpus tetragonolobus]|uniref:Uncharacterized protein n=1 Tax=Psophocarpus tetragonolobus TaxID=3891 RepID=A0AAN9S2U7_PSOTE
MVSPWQTLFLYLALVSKRDGETLGVHDNFEVQAMLKRVVHSLGLVEHREKDSRRKNHLRGREVPPESYLQSKDFVVRIIHAGGHQELYKHAVPAYKLMTKYPGMCVARPEVFKVPHQSVLWGEEVLVPGHKYILISFRDVEKLKKKLFEEGKIKEANGVVLEPKNRSPSGHKDIVKVSNGEVGHEALEAKVTSGYSPKENGIMKGSNGVAGQGVLEKRTTLSPKGEGNTSVVKGVRGLSEEIVDTNMDGFLAEGGVEDSFFCAKDFYVPKDKSTTTRPSRRKGIRGKKPFVPPLPKVYRNLGWEPDLPSVRELSP